MHACTYIQVHTHAQTHMCTHTRVHTQVTSPWVLQPGATEQLPHVTLGHRSPPHLGAPLPTQRHPWGQGAERGSLETIGANFQQERRLQDPDERHRTGRKRNRQRKNGSEKAKRHRDTETSRGKEIPRWQRRDKGSVRQRRLETGRQRPREQDKGTGREGKRDRNRLAG